MSHGDTRGAGQIRGRAEAGNPVLESKVSVPKVPGWAVARPQIEKLIADGARGPLTTVTGPPGAGKTVAIASWAAASASAGALAWVTLDGYDNTPRAFWSYVVAALRRAGLTAPGAVPGSGRGAIDRVFLVQLALALATQDPPVALVLDDLHLLTDPATLAGLEYVRKNAHPGLRLVVASRADPLLPLHRYRLAGELTEIRASDLAFSAEESGLLMAHHGIALPEAAVADLTARTEGWVAGIRLAALSLREHPDPEQFVKELDAEDTAITGYLISEVLNAQPRPVRDVLLRTSILDCVNAELARELADDPQAAGILPDLARANTFVRPVGHGWYRYHSLLAAVLRLKLRMEHRGLVPVLYERAARWYQRNGLLAEAVRCAAESGDWPLAADMAIDEFALGQFFEPYGIRPLADMFAPMPRDAGWTTPQPWLIMAAAGLYGPAAGESISALATAESMLRQLPADEEIPARLAAALIRLLLSRRTGDLAAAAAAAGQAESLAGQLGERVHVRQPGLRARLLAGRGMVALWAGRFDAAIADFTEGAAAARAPEAAYERAECLEFLAMAETLRGRLSRGAEQAEKAREAMRSAGEPTAERAGPAADVALASVFLQRGDIARAHLQLKGAEAALRMRPDKLVSTLACEVAAQRWLAEGRAERARAMVSQARQGWSPPGWLEQRLTVLESRADALAGDIPAAVAAARRAEARSAPDAAAALAHAWLAAGDHQAARHALGPVPGTGPAQISLPVWLADARLSYATGDSARGRRSLECALRLARPERLRLAFLMEQAWIRREIHRDPDLARIFRTPEPGAAAMVLLPRPAPESAQGPEAARATEPLSDRELQVLTHLSEMLSTAEIAAEMYLSVNTVKTHLRSIYRKLAAAHRGEAVRRARQLRLI